MQEILIYIYNIGFIILYLWVINVSSYAYKSTGNRLFNYLELLFVILIIDSAISFSFDLFRTTNINLNIDDQAYCVTKAILFLLGGSIYVKLMCSMLMEKENFAFFCPVISITIIEIIYIIAFYSNVYAQIFQRSIQDLCVLILCFIYFWCAANLKKEVPNKFYYDRIVKITGTFMILSCLEGSLFILLSKINNSSFFRLLSYMKIIGFNEDLFSIVLALMIIFFAKKEEKRVYKSRLQNLVQQKMNQYQSMIHENENSNEENQVKAFCEYYKLTKRESEILRLVLFGKKNQEIADELFISVGTVKSHIYSIYKKLSIDRRSQLMHVFMQYKGK